MPPERSRKLRERIELARNIESHGIEMSPCSYCERNGRKCVVAENSSRCSECARRGHKCDVEGIPAGDWSSLEREEERLDTEEEKAAAQMAEAAARLARLRKQRKFLKSRARDMLRRGLKTLDELDEAEEREQREKEIQMQLAATLQAPSGDPFLDLGLDPSDPFWSTVDLGGSQSTGFGVAGFAGGTASGPSG
jgi:hypothetical protein